MDARSVTVPGLHVGRGQDVGGLSWFPVWVDGPAVTGVAMGAAASVRVGELADGPSVGAVEVENVGSMAALLVEGELLEGGWQHRALNRSVLLASGMKRQVSVSCVEAARWHGGHWHVRRARRAPVSVAGALRSEDGSRQGEVWRRVSRFERTQGPSATQSLVDHLEATSRAHVRQLDGQRGVLVGLGGLPAWLEVFPDPESLASHWDGLVAAAVLSSVGVPRRPTQGQDARDFAVLVGRTVLGNGASAGMGTAVSAARRGVSIRGVCRDDELAHVAAIVETNPLLAAA